MEPISPEVRPTEGRDALHFVTGAQDYLSELRVARQNTTSPIALQKRALDLNLGFAKLGDHEGKPLQYTPGDDTDNVRDGFNILIGWMGKKVYGRAEILVGFRRNFNIGTLSGDDVVDVFDMSVKHPAYAVALHNQFADIHALDKNNPNTAELIQKLFGNKSLIEQAAADLASLPEGDFSIVKRARKMLDNGKLNDDQFIDLWRATRQEPVDTETTIFIQEMVASISQACRDQNPKFFGIVNTLRELNNAEMLGRYLVENMPILILDDEEVVEYMVTMGRRDELMQQLTAITGYANIYLEELEQANEQLLAEKARLGDAFDDEDFGRAANVLQNKWLKDYRKWGFESADQLISFFRNVDAFEKEMEMREFVALLEDPRKEPTTFFEVVEGSMPNEVRHINPKEFRASAWWTFMYINHLFPAGSQFQIENRAKVLTRLGMPVETPYINPYILNVDTGVVSQECAIIIGKYCSHMNHNYQRE